ncbi:cytochrome c biogenesis protein/redoxin [Actinoplanes sp. CA-054009]
MDVALVLIGLVGGVITALSPCILPVLPVIFLSGADQNRRPYPVVAGLVTSFSLLTLLGAVLLAALPIPPGAIRWAGLVALVLLGVGLIVPRFEAILEAPFARLPQRTVGKDRGGFVLGLVLGTVYVPCAGPVLAAITVAGATGKVGAGTIALAVGFAVGTGVTLMIFALAGRAVTARVAAFRRRQRAIRVASGVAVVLLAVGLTFNVNLPNYGTALNHEIQRLLPAHVPTDSDAPPVLAACVSQALYTAPSDQAEDCGPAPALTGITNWVGDPVTLAQLRGKVVLVDFWTFDCINCRHVIPHIEDWYAKYHGQGLEVIGVHTPEYSFEHELTGVQKAVSKYGIKYPVAVDNDYKTWQAYGVQAWPSLFLVDAMGQVRHIAVGEGGYDETESLIRELLTTP